METEPPRKGCAGRFVFDVKAQSSPYYGSLAAYFMARFDGCGLRRAVEDLGARVAALATAAKDARVDQGSDGNQGHQGVRTEASEDDGGEARERPKGGSCDVPVMFYDAFVRWLAPLAECELGARAVRRAWPRGVVLIESEPQCNLDRWITPAGSRFIAVVITLNPDNVRWWQGHESAARYGTQGVFWVAQGYDAASDPWARTAPVPSCLPAAIVHDRMGTHLYATRRQKRRGGAVAMTTGSAEVTVAPAAATDTATPAGDDASVVDVVMPGGENTPYRASAMRALRAAGLVVDTAFAHGAAAMDAAIARARVCAYYPATSEHRHYATQRVLPALNRAAQVVAVRSGDDTSEWLYAGLYETCPAADEGAFVRACLVAASRNDWSERGLYARDAFAHRCNAQSMFERAHNDDGGERVVLVRALASLLR